MSSCGSANCSCGSDCKCGDGCKCSMSADFGGEKTTTSSQTLIVGFSPAKGFYNELEMGVGAENDGCKCGSSCDCSNCSCK